MTSSPAPAPSAELSKDQPLADSAGVPYRAPPASSPIEAWIDLMKTVEALCPRWPEAELEVGRDYRL